MEIKILRCFEVNERIYGEYHVITDNGSTYLVVQNEDDIKVIQHLYERKIEDCIAIPKQNIIKIIQEISKEYTSTDLKFESVKVPVEEACE